MSPQSKAAYIAAVLDCKGGFAPDIYFVSADARVAKWAVKHFGGSMQKMESWPSHETKWKWSVGTGEKFILAVLPYLIVKRDEALAMLRKLRDKDRGKAVTTNTSDSAEETEKRESELHGDVKSAPAVTLVA